MTPRAADPAVAGGSGGSGGSGRRAHGARRWLLLALLVVAVVVAGVGAALVLEPSGAASFGWTAYAPLSDERYLRADFTWSTWRPRVGLALLALGAGTAGASLVALVVRRPPAPSAS